MTDLTAPEKAAVERALSGVDDVDQLSWHMLCAAARMIADSPRCADDPIMQCLLHTMADRVERKAEAARTERNIRRSTQRNRPQPTRAQVRDAILTGVSWSRGPALRAHEDDIELEGGLKEMLDAVMALLTPPAGRPRSRRG